MKLNKTQNVAKGVFVGGFNKTFSLLLPFVIRSIIIYKLGIEYVGLNTIFASILSILSFAELGFGQVMIYSMYKPIAENNSEKICALYGFYKKVYRVIGLVMLIVGLIIVPFLQFFINGAVPSNINLYIVYFVYLFNTVISYWLFAYKDCLLSAHQQYYVSSFISLVVVIVKSIFEMAVLLIFVNYYVYVIILPISTILYNCLISIIVDKKYPQYTCSGIIDKQEQKEIGKTVMAGIGHKLGPSATTSVDNIVISSFLGVTALGIYSNYSYIQNAIMGFFAIIFTSFSAGIGNSLETDDIDKNYKDFNRLVFINNWLVGFSSVCFLCLYQHFICLWVGENMQYSDFTTIILLSIMFYTQQIRGAVTTYKSAAGMWYTDRFKPYVATLLNIILDIILIIIIGINGIIISTIIARSLVGIPWETHALFKNLFKRSSAVYYTNMLINTVIWIVFGFGTYYICSFISNTGIGWFILKIIVCIVVPNIIYALIFCRSNNMRYILSKIRGGSIWKKRK